MGTGIGIIWRPNGRGGLQLSKGDQFIMDLLCVALLDGTSRNPFQSIGLSEGIIFENPDQKMWNDLRVEIKEIFERFEENELAKLDERPDNLQSFKQSEGTYGMKIYFINLEKSAPGEGQIVAGVNGLKGQAV